MYSVSAILAQHAGNIENFNLLKHAEEHAAFLIAHGTPCLIRKVNTAREPGQPVTGEIVSTGRAALAETRRRAERGEIVHETWMDREAPGLGIHAGRWLA